MSELKLTADQLRDTRRFDEYGVESVMIAELVKIMQKRIQGKLAPSLLLEYTSIAALTDYFFQNHANDFGETAHAPVVFKEGALESGSSEESVVANTATAARPQFDIAVVGISCRFPGASSKTDYWHTLRDGTSALNRINHPRWQAGEDRFFHGGWLPDIESFDAAFFNIADDDAAVMDPQARVLLEETLFALYDGGYESKGVAGENVGVYIGGRSQAPLNMDAVLKAPNPILGSGQNYLATNISRFFDFRGPSVVVDTGCSSALTGMLFASEALRSGRITMAVVGGVSLLLTSDAHRLFAERNILSESGEFRIFDREATGEVLGEGAGIVLLKRLEDAIADGNQIYGVVKSISINNDGRTIGPGSPNIHAQKQVMIEALRSAGIRAEDVGYIEANGGGSPVVDAVEIKALSDVYRLGDCNLRPCFVGSVKPNIGHLLLASGLAGFIRCVLSVHHGQIPPFLSALDPFEYYDFSSSRIRFNRDAEDWQAIPGGTRIAAQNSNPDGGTNAHVLVQAFEPDSSYHQRLFEKPKPALKRSRFPWAPVSASSQASLSRPKRITTSWGEYDEKSI